MLTESFSDFFDTDEFAVVAVYNNASIIGILDNNSYVTETSTGVETTSPRFICASDDVSGIAHNDTITIDGVDYTVVGVRPDGTGVTMLVLEQ